MATGYILVDSPNPYTAQGTYPRRGGAQLSGTCIVHTSEGNWRGGVDALTNLVRSRADYGCYHRACDWQDIAAYYPWEWETWQDSETNNWAAGISAACKTTDWGNMPADVEEGFYRNLALMAADFINYMASKEIHVPLRRITGAQARARVPGFAAHGDSGVSRSDPGVNFDWDRFFKYTADVLNGAASPNPVTEEENFMTSMHDYLNTPAFTDGPTISEMFKETHNVHEAIFNNDGTNASILGGFSISGLDNHNAVKILEAVDALRAEVAALKAGK